MSINALELEIRRLRDEAIACAIVGDSIGAALAHNEAVALEQQLAEARLAQVRVSEK